jgi:hypothetical protein
MRRDPVLNDAPDTSMFDDHNGNDNDERSSRLVIDTKSPARRTTRDQKQSKYT